MEYSRGKSDVVDMMLMSKFDGNIKNFAASANKMEEQSIEVKTQEARVEAQLAAIPTTVTPQTSILIAERRVVLPDQNSVINERETMVGQMTQEARAPENLIEIQSEEMLPEQIRPMPD